MCACLKRPLVMVDFFFLRPLVILRVITDQTNYLNAYQNAYTHLNAYRVKRGK